MAHGTIKAIIQKITDAVNNNKDMVLLAGKFWKLEHVNGNEYRITDDHNTDAGLRWTNINGKLYFFMA